MTGSGECDKITPVMEMDQPKRKQIRLEHYDYSQPGAYFITICADRRAQIFGSVCRGDPCGRPEVRLAPLGRIAEQTLSEMEARFGITILQSVIMPNHIHFVYSVERATARVAPTVGRVVGAYKSLVVNRWRTECNRSNLSMGRVWQRNFYEHVIRNERELQACLEYIQTNPARWDSDEYFA